MTIIVVRDNIMACDTLGTGGQIGRDLGSKIVRVKQGLKKGDLLIGCAGDFGVIRWARTLIDPVVDSIEAAETLWDGYAAWAKEAGKVKDGDTPGNALFLACGVTYMVEMNGNVLIHDRDYAAAGCGEDVALGALHVGAGAELAVRAAMEHNIYCGGRCVVEMGG